MILTREQLVSEWTALGAREVRPCRDNRVFCPTLKWVDQFEKHLSKVLPRGKQEAEKVDCDDFAIETVAEAGRALRSNKELTSCGHSVGMAEVIISPLSDGYLGLEVNDYRQTHMTNVIRTTKGWLFYEAQTGRFGDAKLILNVGALSVVLWVWV